MRASDHDTATITQGSSDPAIATLSNQATVTQNGSNQQGSIFQTGDTNRAEVTQRNIDNIAQVNQDGSNNHGKILQAGGTVGAESYITQTSDNNFAQSDQYNGASYSDITQLGGDMNVAGSVQQGSSSSTILQNGGTNNTYVTQNGKRQRFDRHPDRR